MIFQQGKQVEEKQEPKYKRKEIQKVDGKKFVVKADGRKYSLKNNKNRFLFPNEWNKLLDTMGKGVKHTSRILLNTAARINEARNIAFNDVDFVNNRVTLRVTKMKAKKGENEGKVRIIPISSKFSKYLAKYARENKIKGDMTFKLLSTPAMCIGIKKAGEFAGLSHPRDLSAHTFRKTFEVWMMSLGVIGDLGLTAHMGHDIRTAASNYVSPDVFSPIEKLEIERIMGDLYNRK